MKIYKPTGVPIYSTNKTAVEDIKPMDTITITSDKSTITIEKMNANNQLKHTCLVDMPEGEERNMLAMSILKRLL